MKVLIHALGATVGGGRRHLVNFIPALGHFDALNDYTVLVRESFDLDNHHSNIKIERISDAFASTGLNRLFYDSWVGSRSLNSRQYDVVVSLTNFGPVWTRVPHVVFQRNALYFCPSYLQMVGISRRVDVRLRRRLAYEMMKRAAFIVTPSNAMADMIRQVYPDLADKRFSTLYHGFTWNTINDPLADRYLASVDTRKTGLLYATYPGYYKGFEVLFETLAHLKELLPKCVLYLTIERSQLPVKCEGRIRKFGLKDRVVFLGPVPPRQMGALYQLCDLMIYPSLTESFGFPLVEAMACGLPIVAAGTAVNQEICGEAALYYPPLDARAAAGRVLQVLTRETQRDLAEKRKQRMSSFDWSWQRYVRQFVELLSIACGVKEVSDLTAVTGD
jgi:glycosyltransferase involved in cell wall biosynthesis